MRNLIEWGCAKDGKFDMIKYIYCKADVEVLKKGWIVFRDSPLSEYDIDVFSYPTMASLRMRTLSNKVALRVFTRWLASLVS